MSSSYSDQQLQAYLDELLPAELMAGVESELRKNEQLRERLVALVGMREAGVHGLGEIWRRNRLDLSLASATRKFRTGCDRRELAEVHSVSLGNGGLPRLPSEFG